MKHFLASFSMSIYTIAAWVRMGRYLCHAQALFTICFRYGTMRIVHFLVYLEQLVEVCFLHKFCSTYPPTDGFILCINYKDFFLVLRDAYHIVCTYFEVWVSEKLIFDRIRLKFVLVIAAGIYAWELFTSSSFYFFNSKYHFELDSYK